MAPKAAPPSPAPTELDTDTTLADTQSEGSVSQGGSGSRSRSPPALVAAPRAAVGGEEQGQEAAPPVQADLLGEEVPFASTRTLATDGLSIVGRLPSRARHVAGSDSHSMG